MGLGWDSVLKLAAFGAFLMLLSLFLSYFPVGISYNSFWFSIQIIVLVLLFGLVLISWAALKKVIQ